MAEADFSGNLMKQLRRYGDAHRIENMIAKGTPDINSCIRGVEFWIETKFLMRWPVGIVKIEHFTTDQRIWLRTRARAGGLVFVALYVANVREVLLIPGAAAADLIGDTTRAGLISAATYYSCGAVRWVDLIRACRTP